MAHSRRRRSLAEMIPLTEGLVTTAEGFWFGGTDRKAWSHESPQHVGGTAV